MQSPHDTLFGFTFRHRHHAAGWLKSVLRPAIAETIDWLQLTPIRERFPGARLRPHLADAGFVAPLRTSTEIRDVLLLPEHKSFDDPAVTEQLLRYSIHLQRALQQRAGSPPPVLPVLLRHGFADRPRAAAPLPVELVAAQPSQRIFVDDLDQLREAEIAARDQTPLATLTLLCLRSPRDATSEQTTRFFERWRSLLRAVDRTDAPPAAPPLGPDAVDAFGWYALAVTDVDSLALSDTFCRILQRKDISIMSTLERTFQKGVARGKAEGLAEAKADTLLRQLARRFGPLDAPTVDRIQTSNVDQLDRWLDRFVDAEALEAVFDQ